MTLSDEEIKYHELHINMYWRDILKKIKQEFLGIEPEELTKVERNIIRICDTELEKTKNGKSQFR